MATRVRHVRNRPVLTEAAKRRYLEKRVEEIERKAKQLAPGSMPKFIWSEVTGDTGRVLCNHHAVTWVVRGTKPHTIEPRKRNGTLVFDWPKGGLNPAFFKKVEHPGTPARDFLSAALWSTR